MTSLRRFSFVYAVVAAGCLTSFTTYAQQAPQSGVTSNENTGVTTEAYKNKFNRLSQYYRSWLNEDVLFIITPPERESFLNLQSDEQRQQFIGAFWARHNPNEGSNENFFEEEHYRRIAYANAHFGDQLPGWRSDRGRVYIMFGPPDAVTDVPAGGDCDNAAPSASGMDQKAPAHESWRYRSIEGIGDDVTYDFVARGKLDPAKPDRARPSYALSVSPCSIPAPATSGMPAELESKLNRRYDLGPPRTIISVAMSKSALPQNRDLEAAVTSRLVRTQLPLQLEFELTPVTTITSVATLRILVPANALFQPASDAHHTANFKAYGRLENTVSRRIESWFECDTSPKSAAQVGQETQSVVACEKHLVVPAGVYELRVAAKEEVSQQYGTAHATVAVPGYVAESVTTDSAPPQ